MLAIVVKVKRHVFSWREGGGRVEHTGDGQLALTLQERRIGVDELLRLETKKPISIFRLQKSFDSLAPAPQIPNLLINLEFTSPNRRQPKQSPAAAALKYKENQIQPAAGKNSFDAIRCL